MRLSSNRLAALAGASLIGLVIGLDATATARAASREAKAAPQEASLAPKATDAWTIEAKAGDFKAQTHRVFRTPSQASRVEIQTIAP